MDDAADDAVDVVGDVAAVDEDDARLMVDIGQGEPDHQSD